MQELLKTLRDDSLVGDLIRHSRHVQGSPAKYASPREPLEPVLANALDSLGIHRLYSHQAEALDLLADGRNVLVATPTASGKSLVFALPVLQSILADRNSRALFLYPTKALAQDQIAGLRKLAMAASPLNPPSFEIYDGDTTQHQRKKIRADPPNVLITNPDMLHFSLLANHQSWEPFLRNLKWVVLDELHVYRGMFGAHVHHVLRRLKRLAGGGKPPRIVAASATIGNPEEFAGTLTGETFTAVTASGAAGAERHVMFLNPVMVSPYTVAVRVVAAAAKAGLRTIAFTKARRITELLHTWLVRQEPELAGQVAPYRAGYLPEERRRIEERLFRGDLKAVLTTSALELGIDVGGLDVCVLVGYPGSLMSSWQRIGRVGRTGRPALVVMVAMPDTLDQYVISHPDRFFGDGFEQAVLDPTNEVVAARHLVCAAAETPLRRDELREDGDRLERLAEQLVDDGELAEDEAGERFISFRLKPHRHMNLRGAGRPFTILEAGTGTVLGSIDGGRVYQECHPDAIYLHGGRTLRIRELDVDKRVVTAEPYAADYYTVVLGEKETEILEVCETREMDYHRAGYGRLKVTVRIHGYQKKKIFGGETISEYPLEAPEQIYETTGFWIEMPTGWAAEFAARERHFMGGIHAAEHALIGLFPLLAISDRGDIGGISHTGHPQLNGPGIFIYDGTPGGAGLAERGYRDLESLLRQTLAHVVGCPCEDGCPGCIHSPKCGNGNRPLDKIACREVLEGMLGEGDLPRIGDAREIVVQAEPEPATVEQSGPRKRHGIVRAPEREKPRDGKVLVMDLETRRSAEEVGGWGNADRMGLALAVVYDVNRQEYRTYFEEDVDRLLLDLLTADQVVGFNVDRFDLKVLSGYTDGDLGRVRTCDLLTRVHGKLGYRLSLQHLSEVNLGESKSGSGLDSLKWWKEGKIDLIESYCRKDVEMTRKLWETGRSRGYLLYRDKRDRTLRIPADW
ncbi:MAG: DEAD/DEAH box helicase [Acidobacteria bacterium]|uniref:DEAD/DEAH box helicase n=1 Tax=Candidatus Polarisedimenticola svalbardensis TaxID=2886004 RepID=A0A8J6XTT3_9BACT|nr:DEAD/DEAH box helicase [Candidatus Polarisedimenticola svalbardensis]